MVIGWKNRKDRGGIRSLMINLRVLEELGSGDSTKHLPGLGQGHSPYRPRGRKRMPVYNA